MNMLNLRRHSKVCLRRTLPDFDRSSRGYSIDYAHNTSATPKDPVNDKNWKARVVGTFIPCPQAACTVETTLVNFLPTVGQVTEGWSNMRNF